MLKADILDIVVYSVVSLFMLSWVIIDALAKNWFWALAAFFFGIFAGMAWASFNTLKRHKELCLAYDKVEATTAHQDRIKRLEAKKRVYLDRPNEETFNDFDNYRRFCEDQMSKDISNEIASKAKTESILK